MRFTLPKLFFAVTMAALASRWPDDALARLGRSDRHSFGRDVRGSRPHGHRHRRSIARLPSGVRVNRRRIYARRHVQPVFAAARFAPHHSSFSHDRQRAAGADNAGSCADNAASFANVVSLFAGDADGCTVDALYPCGASDRRADGSGWHSYNHDSDGCGNRCSDDSSNDRLAGDRVANAGSSSIPTTIYSYVTATPFAYDPLDSILSPNSQSFNYAIPAGHFW